MPTFSETVDLPCVIIAGGKSRRFGGAKGAAELNGRSLLQTVADCLRPQTIGSIAVNTNEPDLYDQSELAAFERVPDTQFEGEGPLAGLLSAVLWGRALEAQYVVTAPVDTPFLPSDLIEKLAQPGGAAIAQSGDQTHPICGIWPTELANQLQDALGEGMRSARAWAEHVNAANVAFAITNGQDPFVNINTRADLLAIQDT